MTIETTLRPETPAPGVPRRKLALLAIPVAFAVGGGVAMATAGPLGTDEQYEAARAVVERVGGPAGWPATPEFEGVFPGADPGRSDAPGDPLRVRDGAFERLNSDDGAPAVVMGRYEVVFDAVESQRRCQELYDWLRRTGTNDLTLTVENCVDGLKTPSPVEGLQIASAATRTADDPNLDVRAFAYSSPESSRRVLVVAVERLVVRNGE